MTEDLTSDRRLEAGLHPAPGAIPPLPVGATELAAAYAYPAVDAPWLRAIFVSSLDGSATLDGTSGGLGNRSDARIFALGRALADVVLVGAGTVRGEGYGPAEVAAEWRFLRDHRPPSPTIAVVSRALDLDLSGPLFTAAPDHARTIVLTSGTAPDDRRRAASKVADVIVAGDTLVDPALAVAALVERGHHRISFEGGPRLFAQVIAADLLDELCLTLSPHLVVGDAARITNGHGLGTPSAMRLLSAMADQSYLFLRYVRA